MADTLFPMDDEQAVNDGPVTCLGIEFENDEKRREFFRDELRKKLPELRLLEGFPIGEDDDIIALSDPPYYTACPNPWINSFVKEWEAEKNMLQTKGMRSADFEVKEPYNRYKIAGVRIKVDPSITENTDAYYDEFKAGNLDACSLPQKHMDEKSSAKQVEGDSVFKLNVNSCTQEQWTERFGPSGSISAGHSWDVKPWMSNENFLNGLFWSIDRKTFADKRGVQPSINYFSGSYMSDPQNSISYNSTDDHKEAVKNYHNVRKEVAESGVVYTDLESAMHDPRYAEMIRTHFMKLVPPTDTLI